ncbi:MULTISPECIES: hypothetical protein [Bradyrhizobium]|uniref:hypothetical protein n=1 Tax=Bradyrhizobium TaxID=374 RepID=UPI00041654A3|nr:MULTISPECIES: hypothetical protein [Bradyrhizobium]QOG20349.1 hypothetical protein FOM02_26380 [Bradyrhizobium sp. SEMIA]UFW45259.1 hypothetical protein BaraCB756_23265 [Bradyrhizobium arachidis]
MLNSLGDARPDKAGIRAAYVGRPKEPWVSALRTYIALLVFLGSYLVLTVVGNLLYFTNVGEVMGKTAIVGFDIRNFSRAGSPGYWALLFLPFVVAPPIVIFVRRLAAKMGGYVAALPSLSRPAYCLLLGLLYAYALFSLWNADAARLLLRPADYISALDSRFQLMEALGFWPQVTIKSLLFTLSIYGMVEATSRNDYFWSILTAFNLIAMSIILILLNMKWPLVLFYAANLATIMLFAKRKIVPGLLFTSLALVSYFSVSLLLLRASSTPVVVTRIESAPVSPTSEQLNRTLAEAKIWREQFGTSAETAEVSRESFSNVLTLSAGAIVNRMAQPFPYYYEIFSKSEGKCGSLGTRILRQRSPCQPSNLVYAAMFDDRFSGVGTAPQGPHVTGFALQGWLGAIIELVCTSIVLGLFAAASGDEGTMQATITVMGAVTGYFFSQLPFEGPLIYDHGAFWWMIPLLLYAEWKRVPLG